jgi:hypothetical protein
MSYGNANKLPSDPEDQNDFRSETFATALEVHASDYGNSRKPHSTQITDLVANLGHWDDRNHSGKTSLAEHVIAGMVAYDDQTEGEGKAFAGLLNPSVFILTHKHKGDTHREIHILTPTALARLQPILDSPERLAAEFRLPFEGKGRDATSVTAEVVTAEYL